MTVLVLDNYDSFTWNLVQALEALGADCLVRRSDAIDLAGVAALQPNRIVLSPGPFGPDRTGVCAEVVQAFSGQAPILGVCLGMQVIAVVAGAAVAPSGRPVHGKASPVAHNGQGIFAGLPSPFMAARYHSLHVVPGTVPQNLEVTAWSAGGTIMGCRLKHARTDGVLFHPESFLTEHGSDLLRNFLET